MLYNSGMNWFRIIGVLAALWGAGILISNVLGGLQIGAGGSSGIGSVNLTAFVLGIGLLVAGLYAAITGGRPRKPADDE
ncbi:MAG TPA: hypothetical protein VNA17_11090 [Pyrinomonadaceae bacterium]|nr:hypothetical protein [Pyrinomonadaceae bacterium]